MKNRTKLYGCAILMIFLTGTMVHANGISMTSGPEDIPEIRQLNSKDNLVGGWSYVVEDGPEGYQKGLLMIVKDGENYKVQVQIGGNTLLGENVEVFGNKIEFEVMIEGDRVSVGLVAKGETISGKSTTQEGTYNIKGEKTLSME